MATINFEERLRGCASEFAPVVPFAPSDKFLQLDFTDKNKELTDEILLDTNLFIQYINRKLREANAKYGIGGYNENRVIYKRSQIFSPSPTTGLSMQDGTKAPSRWEGDDESLSLVEEETIGYRYADPSLYGLLKDYVLKNRSVPTKAESILWEELKTKKLSNYKFRRQHIIDRFITDFVCLKKKLIIEVDGLIHQLPENSLNDEQRTQALKTLGFDVIRFTNEEIFQDLQGVLNKIFYTLENTTTLERLADLNSPTGGQGAEPRSLHLGIDIWGEPYTKVMTPLNGIVHSFAFNNAFGDYGATIILTHNLDGETFHTLYGHLSLNSIKNLQEGDVVKKGDVIAEFGIPFENGQWPPHLHFQIIKDMEGMKGDYPGVGKYSEREKYLANCPDADLILRMMQYAES